MPNCVLECLNRHYMQDNANVHRGIHTLSERSTCAMEDARKTVADFIGCDDPMQIIFTRGATDSLNQVAFGYAAQYMQKGRKVIVTEFEHHSNFVPWQQAAKRTGAEFVVIPMREDGRLDIEALERELDESVVIVSVTAISNVTGTVLPVREIIQKAHQYNVPVCVDASQAIRHGQMNVRELDCDFLAFSGHKTMGPAGIGVYPELSWSYWAWSGTALFAGNRYKRDCGMGERTDGYAGTETFRTEICARTGRKCGKTECDLCGGRRHSSIRYGKFSE